MITDGAVPAVVSGEDLLLPCGHWLPRGGGPVRMYVRTAGAIFGGNHLFHVSWDVAVVCGECGADVPVSIDVVPLERIGIPPRATREDHLIRSDT